MRKMIESLGRFSIFVASSVGWFFRRPFRWRLLIQEMDFVGSESLGIVALTGTFAGAVMAFQRWWGFEMLGTDSMVLGTTSLSLIREMAPILTAIVVAGRAGAAMAAQIGFMRVTNQIDALEVMAVVPQQYLVGPKIIASALATPLLSSLFALIGTVGGYFVAVNVCHVDPGISVQKLLYYVVPWDFYHGFIKAFVFGILLAGIGCYRGYRARNGAAGVGAATNQAVVYSIVVILVLDYFLSVLVPSGVREM